MNTKNILINGTNVVTGTNNTTYIYKFSSPQTLLNNQIALHSLQMYYSWYNINASLYNNNQFQYMWWNASGVLNQTFTIVIPDGYYSIDSINLYVQSIMLKNGHYIYDTTGKQNIFFFQMISNPTYYAFQIYITPMYALGSVPVNYTKGGSWQYPATQSTPKIIINSSNNFKDLIGFSAGVYPPTNQTVLYQVLSDKTPAISPASSLVIRCNLVRNDLANPNDVLYSFTSGTSSFGDLLNERPNNLYFNKVQDGVYNEIRLQFFDQNFQPVSIRDSQLLMTLVIQEK